MQQKTRTIHAYISAAASQLSPSLSATWPKTPPEVRASGDRNMAQKVLILLGTKKGAFILESDAHRRSWQLRGPFCETWPMNHVDRRSGDRHDLRAAAATNGSARRSGSRTTSARPGRIRARGSPTRRAKSRSRRSGAWRRGRAASTPASSRRGCSGATTAAQSWRHVEGLRDHPSRPHWQPGGGRAHPALAGPAPATTSGRSGSASPRPACSTPPTAATPGSRATAAPGPTSCRRSSAIRSTASACTAW